jgi:hypothetical protein
MAAGLGSVPQPAVPFSSRTVEFGAARFEPDGVAFGYPCNSLVPSDRSGHPGWHAAAGPTIRREWGNDRTLRSRSTSCFFGFSSNTWVADAISFFFQV